MNADLTMPAVELHGVLSHDRDCKTIVSGSQWLGVCQEFSDGGGMAIFASIQRRPGPGLLPSGNLEPLKVKQYAGTINAPRTLRTMRGAIRQIEDEPTRPTVLMSPRCPRGQQGFLFSITESIAEFSSSHLELEDLLLDLLALGDKSVYFRVRIGLGRTNLRFLPFVHQFLDIGAQSSIVGAIHRI
jgi:hypothetical protein